MVEWSAGLITRYVQGQSRTAYREARGHDPQAPVAEFGRDDHVHGVKEYKQEPPEINYVMLLSRTVCLSVSVCVCLSLTSPRGVRSMR